MSRRERTLIYASLALLALANLCYLAGARSGVAVASSDGAAFDDLGPATALTLVDGQKALELRAEDGRLVWGNSERDRAHSLGYVYIGKILPQLMQRDEIKEERERLLEELRTEEEGHRMRLEGIQRRGESLDESSPELQEVFEEWQAAEAAYREWQQTANQRTGALESEYLERSYRELIEAVNVVADRLDIDIVQQFTPTEEPFNAQDPRGAMATIRWRSAMRYPADLDITDEVIEEMDLDLDWKPGE